MRDLVMAAAFEHVEKARQVGVDIGVRVLQRVAHARLGGEMDHHLRPHRGEQLRGARAVGEVDLPEREARAPEQAVQARPLEPRIVVLVQAVDADHAAALGQQPLGQMVADEPGDPGQEDRAVMGEAHRLTGSSRRASAGSPPDRAPT